MTQYSAALCRARSPAGAALPLFGVGQAHPLLGHGADVVAGVEVGLLDLAAVDHVDNVVYGDAATRKRVDDNGGKMGRGDRARFKDACHFSAARLNLALWSIYSLDLLGGCEGRMSASHFAVCVCEAIYKLPVRNMTTVSTMN